MHIFQNFGCYLGYFVSFKKIYQIHYAEFVSCKVIIQVSLMVSRKFGGVLHNMYEKSLKRAIIFYKFFTILKIFFLVQTTIELKINGSKHKSQCRKSQKPLGLSKNALSKGFLEFYQIYSRFCLKRPWSKLQKLLIAIFGQFWLKLAFFIFDPFKKCLLAKFTEALNTLKPLICFKTKAELK